MSQFLFSFEPTRTVLSVTELNARIRSLLDAEFSDVWVSGEISGVKLSSAGHYYFTLKDRDSAVRCVCFRMPARYLKFKPQDGVAVNVRGRIDVYEARGEYQLIADFLEPQGFGALQIAFEQLKKKLAIEGLFEAARKRPIPKLPSRIGIVTSPKGAVIQDMLHVLERRFRGLHVRLYPASVQGEGSIEAVCSALRYFAASRWAEVIIVARGGGSLEDLWTFNEEQVARAIAAMPMPVISAIGHETDFTIADFVADLRAPTPSAAAELVVCTREQLFEQIDGSRRRVEQAIYARLSNFRHSLREQGTERASTLLHRKIARGQQRTDELDYAAKECIRQRLRAALDRWSGLDARLRRTDLRLRFAEGRRRMENADRCLQQAIHMRLAREQNRLQPLTAHLIQLSPTKILDRGYAIVQTDDGSVVRSAESVGPGSLVQVRVAKGGFRATVN